MKKKDLANKELNVNNLTENFNRKPIIRSYDKSLIKGAEQRRLLKKLSRCF